MPSQCKLTYFNGRGVAEPIRYLLIYLGENFEDIRVEFENWLELKPSMPFGKLPVLEIDGKKYSQSTALYRYLGNKGNISGNNDLENLHIDIIADVLVDLRTAASQVMWEPDEQKKKEKQQTFLSETLPYNLEKLEEIAKKNDGYLANKKLSWADFMFASIAENFGFQFPESNLNEKYPTLKALKEKILSIPKIKAHIENRKSSPF
uniref:glutathione transferase n=1 Tax=Clastoptera arizonana TaxID=38151 RepID=A0A1B6CF84_9HEMI